MVIHRIELPQILRGFEVDERRSSGNDSLRGREDVEVRPERRGCSVQAVGIQIVRPFAGYQPSQQGFYCGDGLCRSEGAVAGARYVGLPQEPGIAAFVDHVFVCRFVFDHNQTVSLSVQRENRNVDLPIEDQVVLEIFARIFVGLDTRRIFQRIEIGVEIEVRGLVQRSNFFAIHRVFQLLSIIDDVFDEALPQARASNSARKAKMNGKSTCWSQRNWLASCEAKSFAAGSGDVGINHPGTSLRAATSARRARPCGVACAWESRNSESWKFAVGLAMLTTCNGVFAPSKVLKANSPSSAVFHVATPPERTPHMGRAASKRSGKR